MHQNLLSNFGFVSYHYLTHRSRTTFKSDLWGFKEKFGNWEEGSRNRGWQRNPGRDPWNSKPLPIKEDKWSTRRGTLMFDVSRGQMMNAALCANRSALNQASGNMPRDKAQIAAVTVRGDRQGTPSLITWTKRDQISEMLWKNACSQWREKSSK